MFGTHMQFAYLLVLLLRRRPRTNRVLTWRRSINFVCQVHGLVMYFGIKIIQWQSLWWEVPPAHPPALTGGSWLFPALRRCPLGYATHLGHRRSTFSEELLTHGWRYTRNSSLSTCKSFCFSHPSVGFHCLITAQLATDDQYGLKNWEKSGRKSFLD